MSNSTQTQSEVELKNLWTLADKNKDGKLDVDELIRFFKKINLYLPKKQVKLLASQFSSKLIDEHQFQTVYRQLSRNPALGNLFESLKPKEGQLTVSAFEEFLKKVQHHSDKEAQAIAKTYAKAGYVSCDSFEAYFGSREGSVYHPLKQALYMDMTRPLNEYFMNSSHNTYLSGDQLKSESSVECYVKALLKGCRCVELDCWDGPKGEPIVYHGFTLTSKIFFVDIIKAIRENAFKASPYPVVLSLEVHCSVEQQIRMASILKQELKDILVIAPLFKDDKIPSPQDLKGKILVKGKGPQKLSNEEPEEDDFDDNEEIQKEFAKVNGASSESLPPKPNHHRVADELAKCAIYFQSKKFKGFEESQKTFSGLFISSFSETKAMSLVKKDYDMFVRFNQLAFSRIYPKGSRIDSSNIDPLVYWQVGAQLTALNYQTFDRGLQLNCGLFHQNGQSGYVLKPDYLRGIGKRIPLKKKVSLSIISAFRLPKPKGEQKGEIIDPYVHAELLVPTFANHELMVIEEDFKTKKIDDNGFNPVWTNIDVLNPHHSAPKKNVDMKNTVESPELTFMRFVIKDHDMTNDDFIACGIFPLSVAQFGYRQVPLWSYEGKLLDSSYLLIYIEMN